MQDSRFFIRCLLVMLALVIVNSSFAQQSVRITASALNVRTGPGTEHSKIGLVYQDQKYVSAGRSGSWHIIDFDQRKGWVHGGYLNNDSAGNVRTNVNNYLNVRTGPGTGYRDIGDAMRNQRWVVIGSSGVWRKVNYRGGAYWMHGAYLVADGMPPTVNPPLPRSAAGLLQLPDAGDGFYGFFPREYRWGTARMVYGLMNAAASRRNADASLPRIGVGDISISSGQLFPAGSGSSNCNGVKRRHCSHTEGRYADLRPIAKNAYEGPLSITNSNYSTARTRRWINGYLITTFGDSLNQILFNDQILINEIGIVRYYSGHGNHMHIRLNQ